MNPYKLTLGLFCSLFLLMAITACDTAPGDGFEAIMEPFNPPTPLEAAQNANNQFDPDLRRDGLAWTSTAYYADEPIYQNLFKLYLEDPDPSVRAICVSAIGRTGTPDDIYLILPYAKNESALVRWAVMSALQKLHNDDAVRVLIESLHKDENVDVRVAAANALAQYRQSVVVSALIVGIEDDDFAVVRESENSLKVLTGQDLGDDSDAWLQWAATKRDDTLFADASTYYYPLFIPKTWLDYLMFWRDDWLEDPRPRQPKGVGGTVIVPEDEQIPDNIDGNRDGSTSSFSLPF